VSDIAQYVHRHRSRFIDELSQFLRIPSISTDPEHRRDVLQCAGYVAGALRRLGMQRVEVFSTPGHPLVYGEWLEATERPTALVYGHYDVQPADPLVLWDTPPFEPSVRDGQLYARGAADDKGQVFMHWKAIEALWQLHGRLPLNLKFIFEGEEEIGSRHFDPFLASHANLLAADVAIVSDTAMFARGYPSICYGLRGLAYFQVTVFGPSHDLHSGSFGGGIANPALVLAQLLASLKDEHNRIAIAGFYDDVVLPTAEERRQIASLPFAEEAAARELGVPALSGEEGYCFLEQVWLRPSVDVNGIWGGFTGPGSKTIIPSQATAKVSLRLVPNQDPNRIADRFERHLQAACPQGARLQIERMEAARAVVVPRDNAFVRAAARAVAQGFGKEPVFIRSGGTIGAAASISARLGIPIVMFGIGLPDAQTHAPNEHLDLDNLFRGIVSVAHMWEELATIGKA